LEKEKKKNRTKMDDSGNRKKWGQQGYLVT